MAEPVELRPAYQWTCPLCGLDHYAPGIVVEKSDEEIQEMRLEHGVDPDDFGDFMMMPSEVQCGHCNQWFPTLHFRPEEPTNG